MAWRFEPGETLREAFLRVAGEEVAKVRRDLLVREPDFDAAIHEARQGFKRLRALLRLAKPSIGRDFAAENRRWRDAGRHLSGSRDTTVLLQTFDKVKAKCDSALPESQARRLRATILSQAAKNGAAEMDSHVAEVLTLLDEGEWAIPRLNWPETSAALSKGFRRSQKRLRKDWRKARKTAAADALHAWRKSVKNQAAQLRLLRQIAPDRMDVRRDKEKEIGELLGHEHDLWLLCEHLNAAPIDADVGESRDLLLEEIGKDRERLRERAFRKGRKFSGERGKSFARPLASAWAEASAQKSPATSPAP